MVVIKEDLYGAEQGRGPRGASESIPGAAA